jgi:polynucleotide 5'-hydroxyl-kinase GRC3/NOL9
MHYELLPKATLILRGPASVDLIGGQATILGATFAAHRRTIVPEQRQLPIETESRAELEIVLGKSGKISEIQGSTIPASWRRAAAALEEMGEGKVIILGATDVGKSTLCVYLINKLLNSLENLQVIDADIGQTDLGPPTTIASASPHQPIASLPELAPDARLFIGHTSPSYVQQKLIRSIQKLSANGGRSLTIINTDGWVAERDAILYKIDLITNVNPELVLGLEYGDELQPTLASVRAHSMKIDAAKNVLGRSRGGRRALRVNSYRRFLERALTHSVHLRDIQVSVPDHFPSVTPLNSRKLRNLIIGLLDKEGYLVQIGILIDVEHDAIRIYSRPVEEIDTIEVGYVKLSTSGREIGFL